MNCNRTRRVGRYIALAAFLFSLEAAAEQPVMKIWPGTPPGGVSKTGEQEAIEDVTRIAHVNEPSLTIYLPPKETATGAAVVICPGGGYARLAIGHEGYDLADWLNKQGIAGFVLKYRLYDYGQPAPLADVQRAIRFVRKHAKEWGVDPEKIGIMGSSAGGHAASSGGVHYNDKVYDPVDDADTFSARPNFMILLYPVISMENGITHQGSRKNLIGDTPSRDLVEFYSNELHITQETPPTFIVHATDDTVVPVENSIAFYRGLVDAGVPAEIHMFLKGGHGFGLARSITGTSLWPGLCEEWLKMVTGVRK